MATAAQAQLNKDNAQDKALSDAIAKEVEDRNAAIKVVSDELAKQKDPAQEGTLAKQIADEVARADAEEKDIRADFAEADQGLKDLIDEMKNADKEGTLANLIAALRSDLTAHLTTQPFDGDQPYDDLAPLNPPVDNGEQN
jgi:predicted transcriptional regulator